MRGPVRMLQGLNSLGVVEPLDPHQPGDLVAMGAAGEAMKVVVVNVAGRRVVVVERTDDLPWTSGPDEVAHRHLPSGKGAASGGPGSIRKMIRRRVRKRFRHYHRDRRELAFGVARAGPTFAVTGKPFAQSGGITGEFIRLMTCRSPRAPRQPIHHGTCSTIGYPAASTRA